MLMTDDKNRNQVLNNSRVMVMAHTSSLAPINSLANMVRTARHRPILRITRVRNTATLGKHTPPLAPKDSNFQAP